MTETLILILFLGLVAGYFYLIIMFRKYRDMKEEVAALKRGRILDKLLKPRRKK